MAYPEPYLELSEYIYRLVNERGAECDEFKWLEEYYGRDKLREEYRKHLRKVKSREATS